MFSVDEVIYNMHHFEEENFERFDELYDDVRSGNFTAEKDAVKRLCRTFETEFGQIHPHQYHKAVSMTFMIADKMEKKKDSVSWRKDRGDSEKIRVPMYTSTYPCFFTATKKQIWRSSEKTWIVRNKMKMCGSR